MKKSIIQTMSIIILGFSLGIWASVLVPSITSKKTSVEKPTWQETQQPLTEIERATMSAEFTKDFEKHLEALSATPTPTPFLRSDIPASMAGDMTPPSVSIQSGPLEGATVASSNVCFALWVSDNMTGWYHLQTEARLDKNEWSPWATTTYYCYQNLSDGVHTFTVHIRDLVGNVAPEFTRTFIVKH